MERESRLIVFAAAMTLLSCLNPLTGRVHAGVYDDVVAWWHFDYDPNANGLADLDEIRDQRNWGTTSTKGVGGKHATSLTGALGGPSWENAPSLRPAGGQEYGGRSMLFRPAVNTENNTAWPDTFQANGLGLAGSATLITRLRWDGKNTPLESVVWLYNNHLEWNAYRGWLFGISTNAAGGRLAFYTQRTTSTMDATLTNGVWYDVGVVVTDYGTNKVGTVEFYLWHETGSLVYQKFNNIGITNSINPSPRTIVGSENHSNGYAAGNNHKSFNGAVNHLAVWNRALSFAEVNEAFGNPQPLFQIGIKNNSPFDMRPESETAAEYIPGDPWHTMRRAVTATYREATLKIPLTNHQARLDYMFHVRTQTENNAPADIELIVNTFTNEARTAKLSNDLYWHVTTNMLFAGTNTFTLRYLSGTSPYVAFDWMELAGAWQVGLEDNSPSEFMLESSAPADYFVTNPNWKHVRRAISSGTTNTHVNFALSEELARRCFFTYTTRIVSQGGTETNQHAFSVDLNGTPVRSFLPVPNGTYIRIPLEQDLVQAGMNTIKIRYDDSPAIGGYLQFDFHRLEVADIPKGTIFWLR